MADVTYKDIAKVVSSKIQDGKQADIAKSIATYLVSERRASELAKIMREVERIQRDNQGILEVNVTSAHELDQETENQIKGMFKAKSIILNKQIDKNLVGGVKIQAQDTMIDLSVRGQLNQLKAHKF